MTAIEGVFEIFKTLIWSIIEAIKTIITNPTSKTFVIVISIIVVIALIISMIMKKIQKKIL